MTDFFQSGSLAVKMGNIVLKNPVITCSGTFANGLEYNEFYDISMLGGVTTKSMSLEKMQGNPPPRICETASGMINSIGLQNEGIDYFLENELPLMIDAGAAIIVSIFGKGSNEFNKIARKIKKHEKEILAVEINLSCPNVKKGGMAFCAFPDEINRIISSVRDILETGIIAKLSANFNNIPEAALKAAKGGADAVSIINTIPATAFDINTFNPKLGNITGGLSGPAIKPVALLKVYELAKENIIPVIGMGGIMNWEDAIEFIIAGASAVGIGTANFINPDCGRKIIEGIKEYLRRRNIGDINNLRGIVFKNTEKII